MSHRPSNKPSVAPSVGLYVGTRKGLFTVDAATWRIVDAAFIGDPVTMVLRDEGGDFAALRHGHFGAKLHRRIDNAWVEIPVPAYDEADDATVDTIWALERGGDGTLWLGTIPGGLFKSTDDGASWRLVRSLWDDPRRKEWFGGGADKPGLHSICVDPRDAKRVVVAVSCGGVWLTEDGGETWTPRADGMFAEYVPPERRDDPVIQDPHRVVQCASQPATWWCQHHNGMFKSTDDTASWQSFADVSPSTFGFAVAVHPSDADTAWFVPATNDEKRVPVDGAVVITRTTDGGKTFERITEGLPQTYAYDLVYRHALDVDGAGRKLAFGSTTGSLWASDDGGSSWRCVTANLPPIYVVRF